MSQPGAPPPDHPWRRVDDFSFDPWGDADVRRAWDRDRKRRWIAALSERDWRRLAEAADKVDPTRLEMALDDLDAPIRVAVRPAGAPSGSGIPFGRLRSAVLLAWPKISAPR